MVGESLAGGQDHGGREGEWRSNGDYEDGPGRHYCPPLTAGRSIKGQGCHIDLERPQGEAAGAPAPHHHTAAATSNTQRRYFPRLLPSPLARSLPSRLLHPPPLRPPFSLRALLSPGLYGVDLNTALSSPHKAAAWMPWEVAGGGETL